MHDKVGFAVAVDVTHFAGDGGEVLTVAEEDGAGVDAGMGRVAAG